MDRQGEIFEKINHSLYDSRIKIDTIKETKNVNLSNVFKVMY